MFSVEDKQPLNIKMQQTTTVFKPVNQLSKPSYSSVLSSQLSILPSKTQSQQKPQNNPSKNKKKEKILLFSNSKKNYYK